MSQKSGYCSCADGSLPVAPTCHCPVMLFSSLLFSGEPGKNGCIMAPARQASFASSSSSKTHWIPTNHFMPAYSPRLLSESPPPPTDHLSLGPEDFACFIWLVFLPILFHYHPLSLFGRVCPAYPGLLIHTSCSTTLEKHCSTHMLLHGHVVPTQSLFHASIILHMLFLLPGMHSSISSQQTRVNYF